MYKYGRKCKTLYKACMHYYYYYINFFKEILTKKLIHVKKLLKKNKEQLIEETLPNSIARKKNYIITIQNGCTISLSQSGCFEMLN